MKSQIKIPVKLQTIKNIWLKLIHSKEIDKYLHDIKEFKLDLPVKN
jgi:hypothetical protein